MHGSARGTLLCAIVGSTLAVSLSACGNTARDPFEETAGRSEFNAGARLPDEISNEEIVARGKNAHTAMALIRRLRPAWLRARGQKTLEADSGDYPVVYIDEIRRGGLRSLNEIPASEIGSMQFINTADATTRWGTGHPSGVINIVTGR
ncbi:MAG: hypothetical protein ACR2QM_04935 [Longimicrobiales bacterium]